MPRHKWRFRMYRELAAEAPSILDEIRVAAKDLGISAQPAQPARAAETRPGKGSFDRIRETVKERYSDAYECCIVETPEAGVWMACQSALAEARFRPAYVPRCVAPRQKDLPAEAAVLPPKYKHLYVPAQHAQPPGFDIVLIPLHGAEYSNHGVSDSPVSMLSAISPDASIEALAAAAEVHASHLCGFYSQGQSTPGCGFGPVDEHGIHLLYRGLDELSAEFDVPYVVDDTHALPLLGEIAAQGSSITAYGHQALDGLGLLIGTEELLAPLLKSRPPAAAGDDLYAFGDLMAGLVDEKDRYLRDLSRLYDMVTEGLGRLNADFRGALRVRRDPASLSVEINYEDTWHNGTGFPIFTAQDSKAGANLLESGIAAMGIGAATVMEASITVHLPSPSGRRIEFDEDRAALEIKALVRLLEILGKRSGYLD